MKLTASSLRKIKLINHYADSSRKKEGTNEGKKGEVTTNSTEIKRMITMNSGCQ